MGAEEKHCQNFPELQRFPDMIAIHSKLVGGFIVCSLKN
jgi:hypothetical protein